MLVFLPLLPVVAEVVALRRARRIQDQGGEGNALASGTMTASEIARQIGCSASTLYRHVPGGRTAMTESGVPAIT